MCSNAIKTGESHRGGLDLLFCVDFEQIGHMTWELLSSNAHIYSIKYIIFFHFPIGYEFP